MRTPLAMSLTTARLAREDQEITLSDLHPNESGEGPSRLQLIHLSTENHTSIPNDALPIFEIRLRLYMVGKSTILSLMCSHTWSRS